jgi:hypothetical protein
VTFEVFDVYLEPLVDELLELWAGVPAYDITKDTGERSFQLRAMLLWTIHDFPGYGTVGGFAHQGYAACPWCGADLGAEHSVELGKCTYGGTRRWLPAEHPYRSDAMKCHFNGQMEDRPPPHVVSVEEQMQHAADYTAWKENGNSGGVTGDPSKIHGVKRLSILHRLPYWKVSLSFQSEVIYQSYESTEVINQSCRSGFRVMYQSHFVSDCRMTAAHRPLLVLQFLQQVLSEYGYIQGRCKL